MDRVATCQSCGGQYVQNGRPGKAYEYSGKPCLCNPPIPDADTRFIEQLQRSNAELVEGLRKIHKMQIVEAMEITESLLQKHGGG